MDIFQSYGIEVSPKQQKLFEHLYTVFSDWNSKINISAIREKKAIYKKHFVDSLLATKYIDFHGKKILDLGSGGGFPCFPIAIVSKNSKFFALDSVGKKTKVIQDIANTLNLPIKTFHGRIEDAGHDSYFREQFDIVTARALAPWPTLLEYALPFVKIGGLFVAYQGPAIQKDLIQYKNNESFFGGTLFKIVKETLETKGDRIFVIIKKTNSCPKKYPRSVGIPKKQPLCF